MPTVYQGICDQCGHRTPIMTGGYGAVLMDQPVAQKQHEVVGAVIASGNTAGFASANDPRFLVLAHPLEASILASTGYSWNDLLREGRYVIATNMICRECGTVFPQRRLAAPGATGCTAVLVLGVTAGLAAGIWRRSVIAGLIGWFAGLLLASYVADYLASRYIRLRFAERAASLAAERSCPTCQADNAEYIGGAKKVTCAECRNQTLHFVVAGKS